MKKLIIKIIPLTALALILFYSCEDAAEWYLGFNKQPEFFDGEEYSKVINVFGVIRPGEIDGGQQSFIRVEKTVSSKEIEFSDSLLLPDANVVVTYSDSLNEIKNIPFSLFESDSSPDVFINNDIEVDDGKTYYLECSHQGFDTVHASTTVPHKPVVLSAIKDGNTIHIEVKKDASAYLYEAVYNSVVSSGYVVPKENNTEIKIELGSTQQDDGEIIVFAYDKNFADYFSDITSSILNLNSFRAPYTTVEGGYGCFGSLNLMVLPIVSGTK